MARYPSLTGVVGHDETSEGLPASRLLETFVAPGAATTVESARVAPDPYTQIFIVATGSPNNGWSAANWFVPPPPGSIWRGNCGGQAMPNAFAVPPLPSAWAEPAERWE